jgi:hypothetical protein
MDIRGINVKMMSNNRQVRDNASNTEVKHDANTRDSVVDDSSVRNIKITKKKDSLKEIITVEEIRDGKKYLSFVEVEPSRSRVMIDIFGPVKGGEVGFLGSYEIRKDMIMDSHGLKSTLPREVIDLLFLLKDNGVDFGEVNIEEIANRKPNKIYDLAYRFGIGLYEIIGGIVGASIFGAIGVLFGPISPVLNAIVGGLFGLSVGLLLESNEYIKYAWKGNKYLKNKEK